MMPMKSDGGVPTSKAVGLGKKMSSKPATPATKIVKAAGKALSATPAKGTNQFFHNITKTDPFGR